MNRTKGRKFVYDTRKMAKRKVPCLRCGSPTWTSGTTGTCQECKDETHRIKMRENADHSVNDYDYIVVSDPNKTFGYPTGAVFTPCEVECMCQANLQAFSYGTILRRRDKYYRVELYAPKRRLKLIEIKEPTL